MNNRRLSGPLVVTGAAAGIGRAIAQGVANEHTHILLLDRNQEGLAETVRLIRDAGGSAEGDSVDVGDSEAVRTAVGKFAAAHGPLAGVASAAGVLTPGTLAETTVEEWNRHFAINTTGVFNLLQATEPVLGDGASVVVISSNTARVPRAGMVAYAASKAATSALTRCVGLELAPRGIRCNVIEPGSTATAMQRDLWADPELGQAAAIDGDPSSYRVGIPLGRIGEPEDVAELAVFLLSDAARQITLQQIYVDGGASL